MVNHLTRVSLQLLDAAAPLAELATADPLSAEGVLVLGDRLRERTIRVATMMRELAARGFVCRLERQCVIAESTSVGAREAKDLLVALGFRGSEFEIHLSYERQWGML